MFVVGVKIYRANLWLTVEQPKSKNNVPVVTSMLLIPILLLIIMGKLSMFRTKRKFSKSEVFRTSWSSYSVAFEETGLEINRISVDLMIKARTDPEGDGLL